MMNTPKLRRLSMRTMNRPEAISSPQSSPVRDNEVEYENDDSPLYFPTTQETNEEIDVLWDWHSPQTSQRRRFRFNKQKRSIPIPSPNIPIKRNNSHNENFERLREELRALQADLAVPDDEDSLRLSPLQEHEIKCPDNNNLEENVEKECQEVLDGLINDSLEDDQLLMCTQILEDNLKKEKCQTTVNKSAETNSLIDKYTSEPKKSAGIDQKSKFNFQRTLSDDRFNKSPKQVLDNILPRTKSFEVENLTLTKSQLEEIEKKRREAVAKRLAKQKLDSQVVKPDVIEPSQNTLTREKLQEIERKRLEAIAKLQAKRNKTVTATSTITSAETKINITDYSIKNNVIQTISGKLELHRTKSFELEAANQKQILTAVKLEEIEKNKMEALARLQARKKQAATSSTKCSPDEIESKRLQARAKLEAKKVKELIEKKRLEALQRLQNSRMKNAGFVKSTLDKRY